MLWLASSYLEHEATVQEGVKKYHLCLSIATNSLWEALNVKARSPDKFMDVSDMQVSDEDGYMTRNLTITANSKIANAPIWIDPVISEIAFQPLHSDTDMSKNPINGVEAIVRDGRGFNMTLDAHSFELVYQKTNLSTDDFTIIPRKSQMSVTLKRYTRSVSLQFERNPICTLCSTREMSQMECGRPGNFSLTLLDVK